MKIQLPNGEKIELCDHASLDEKKETVQSLTLEWEQEIMLGWGTVKITYFLDGLANYLIWHKEEKDKNKEDKEVLSIWKVEQLSGKRKPNSTPFSSLTASQKELLFGEVLKNG